MNDNINNKNFLFFALNASKKLGNEIAKKLNKKLEEFVVTKFADGEVLVKPNCSVRNKEIYVIESTSKPVNDNLIELLIAIDALKRSSAKKINVIMPYFGYARQDCKTKGREPITSKLVANLLTTAGVDRLVTIDIHSPQMVGFFDIPIDDLKSIDEISLWIFNYIKSKYNTSFPKICIVSPDNGGLIRARKIANKFQLLNASVAVIDKRRPSPNISEIEYILGDVKDKICFIVDDMIDTGGTIVNAATAIKEKGALEVSLIATHPVFSDPATARINKLIDENIIKNIVVSNSIELKDNKVKNLKIISLADFIASIIKTSVSEQSISNLYIERAKKFNSLLIEYVNKTKKG